MILTASTSAERGDEMKAVVATAVPARRIAAPDEIAAAVVFLASQQSSFVHGPP